MKTITLDQKVTAQREFGVILSTKCTENHAVKQCKHATKSSFSNEII